MEAVESLKNVIVIGKPEMEIKDCVSIGDLLADDGKSAPKKLDVDWEKQTIFLPFTSTSGSTDGSGTLTPLNFSASIWKIVPRDHP